MLYAERESSARDGGPADGWPTAAGREEIGMANPEKSGGAKLRDYGAGLVFGQKGVMFAGLQLAKPGKPGDAKVGAFPTETRGMAARPPDEFVSRFKLV